MRPWLAFLLLAALVVAATLWHRQSTPVPAPPSAASPVAGIPATMPTAPRRAAPPLPLDDAEQRAQLEAMRAQNRTNVDRVLAAGRNKIVGRYESETIDPAWANATRQELTRDEYVRSSQVRDTHSEPLNIDIDCRRTTCRVVADFPNVIAADDWSTLYLTGVGSRLPTAWQQKSDNADGSVRLEIYLMAQR